MHPRASELIQTLGLEPHPEGGWYREVYRSAQTVERHSDGARRAALTSIHYLLPRGTVSRWHRVVSCEAWHHLEGAPLRLYEFPAAGGPGRSVTLGPSADHQTPVHVIEAGLWQGALTTGDYALVGCSVAPGFVFDDHCLLADHPERDAIVPEGLPFWRALL